MQYVISTKYVSDNKEHKLVFSTVSLVLQEVEQLLRGSQPVEYIRITPHTPNIVVY